MAFLSSIAEVTPAIAPHVRLATRAKSVGMPGSTRDKSLSRSATCFGLERTVQRARITSTLSHGPWVWRVANGSERRML